MIPPFDWREEPIGRRHDRRNFDCGQSDLNIYLERFARQNHEAGGAKTYVAVRPAEPARVLGYYSISPGEIEFARVPANLVKGSGRYNVPVFRLARLAVDRSLHGQGLGGALFFAAGARAMLAASKIGGMALAIDAKDDAAVSWYSRFGAQPLLDDPLKLILPLATLAQAVAASTGKRG